MTRKRGDAETAAGREIALQNDSSFSAAKLLLKQLKEKYSLEYSEIIRVLEENEFAEEKSIPVDVLATKSLGMLEAITKYLHENAGMRFSEIAERLNRDTRTIWSAYSKARQKKRAKFPRAEKGIMIPVSVFSNRVLGPAESAVHYLKETRRQKLSSIAKMLNRDPRTVGSAYAHAKKKLSKRGRR